MYMKPQQSQTKGDIFEMILSANSEGQVSHAHAHHVHEKKDHAWEAHQQEGQLAVDVYDTEHDIIIVTTMAGAETDKIEVYVHNNDLLTIRGIRTSPVKKDINIQPAHQECFWGKFSRTIVLPSDVDGALAKAEYKSGVLSVTIPKQDLSPIQVEIVED